MTAIPIKSRVEGQKMILRLDLPLYGCAQNSRLSRQEAAAQRAEYRKYVQLMGRSVLNGAPKGHPWKQFPPRLVRISISFGIYQPKGALPRDGRYRPHDIDNAVGAFKPGMDGLRDARIILDDSYRNMRLGDLAIDEVTEGILLTVEVLEW